MSDKPVYQSLFIETEFHDGWRTIDKQTFEDRSKLVERYEVRILYPASAYEALKKDRDMYKAEFEQWIEKTEWVQQDKSNLFFGFLGFHRADAMTMAIQVQRNEVEALKAENEAQAKRIAELEDELKISKQLLKNYADILSDDED